MSDSQNKKKTCHACGGQRAKGALRGAEFIIRVQHAQMRRMHRHIMNLCAENEELGGAKHKQVRSEYDVGEVTLVG